MRLDRAALNRLSLLEIMLLPCLLLTWDASASARMLIIAEAQDTTGVFQALSLPELGSRALVWPEGVLISAETVPWLDDGAAGLALELQEAALAGVGAGGRFRLYPGRYDLDTPLVLTDGEVILNLSAGKLQVSADRIMYQRPRARTGHSDARRGEYYVLAGVILATALLLRAARRRTRRS